MDEPVEDQLEALRQIKAAINRTGSGWPTLDHIEAQLERSLGAGNYPKPLVGDLAELRSELLDLSIKLERLNDRGTVQQGRDGDLPLHVAFGLGIGGCGRGSPDLRGCTPGN